MIFKLVTGVEAHGTMLTTVFLHRMCPEMFVKLRLIVEGLVTVLTLICFIEMSGKYVRLEISEE